VAEHVASKGRIVVSSIVAGEALYYRETPGGVKKEIRVGDDASKNLVEILEADLQSIPAITAKFANWFVDNLHPGEIELLALLAAAPADELSFCSSDGAAISAAAMLGFLGKVHVSGNTAQAQGARTTDGGKAHASPEAPSFS